MATPASQPPLSGAPKRKPPGRFRRPSRAPRIRSLGLPPRPARPGRRFAIGAAALVLVAAGGAAGWAINDATESETVPSAPAPPVFRSPDAPPAEVAEELGFPEFATRNTTRIAGPDATAIAAATALAVRPSTGGVEGPAAVAVVDLADWATALAATSLAADPIGIPLLLSSHDQVPGFTADAISELGPRGSAATHQAQIYRIGDVAVPSGYKVVDVNGEGSAELAASIDKLRGRLSVRHPEHIVIVGSSHPEYGLPAGGWSALSGDAILLSDQKKLPKPTADALARHPDVPVYVLASPNDVSDDVLKEIGKGREITERITGPGPVSSAISFARYSDDATDFGWDINFPGHGFVVLNLGRPSDAAAAAGLSGSGAPGPTLLTDSPTEIPQPLQEFLLDNQPGFENDPTKALFNHLWVIGDSGAISVDFQAQADALLNLTRISTGSGEPDFLGPKPGTPEHEHSSAKKSR